MCFLVRRGVRPGCACSLLQLGKVIGGGLPVGAYGGRRDIMEMVAPAGAAALLPKAPPLTRHMEGCCKPHPRWTVSCDCSTVARHRTEGAAQRVALCVGSAEAGLLPRGIVLRLRVLPVNPAQKPGFVSV